MAAKLRAPGWYRAALSLPVGAALAFALVLGGRTFFGYPLLDDDGVE